MEFPLLISMAVCCGNHAQPTIFLDGLRYYHEGSHDDVLTPYI